MVDNKSKIDRIHDSMPRYLKTRSNPNWKALIESIGEQDENLTTLIEEVRKQFFIKTASRPYLDRLGANVKVSRPASVGMDDPTFRRYIPVLAYQPKQVKLILDQLLDIFFFKESTSAFTQTQNFEPFQLEDGWELNYLVDRINEERIIFDSSEFSDITNASADEVAAAINRKAENSFAVVFDDRVQKRKFVRIFTNTVGSKGAIQVTGGRSNIAFRFLGYKDDAGNDPTTQWTITKVGGTITWQHTGGVSPNLQNVETGDIAIIDAPGNEGSFVVESVDVANATFSYTNPFGTSGSLDHSIDTDSFVKFIVAEQLVVYTRDSRAVVWETAPGQIIVEMPASPPVVKRTLEGSAHINGTLGTMVDRIDATSLELDDATDFPLNGGQFVIQELKEIQMRHLTSSEDSTVINQDNTRYDKQQIYTYTSKTGNVLNGVTPDLPGLSGLFQHDINTLVRDSAGTITVTTATAHDFEVGETVRIQDVVSDLTTIGVRIDVSVTDTAPQVAAQVASALNSLADFSAGNVGNVATVTTSANGVTTDAVDVDSGVGVSITQQGTAGLPEITELTVGTGATYDVAGNGLRLNINSAGDATEYHVWFNVTDGANEQINAGLDDLPSETYEITEVVSNTEFKFFSLGESGNGNGGLARVERIGMADAGSTVYLTSARLGTGILGPNIWDPDAAFVLSSLTSDIQEEIRAGTTVRTIEIADPNNIPNEEGFVIFDFGTENEEGPVRYLFKPTDTSLQIDPAYIFENNHEIGSAVTVIRRRGAHVISSTGREYAPYLTDPATARVVLQELLRDVKSVGIFIEFLIRYPEQLYATLDVYRSCDVNLYPINEDEAAACSI